MRPSAQPSSQPRLGGEDMAAGAVVTLRGLWGEYVGKGAGTRTPWSRPTRKGGLT